MKYLILLIVVFSNLANSNGLDDKLNIIKISAQKKHSKEKVVYKKDYISL